MAQAANEDAMTMHDADFQIDHESVSEGVVLRPRGDIDLSRSPVLRTEIASVWRKKPSRLIIDLDDVGYMDSSGVATLVEALGIARKHNAQLVLCGLREKVRSIFEIARLETVFTIVDDVNSARTM